MGRNLELPLPLKVVGCWSWIPTLWIQITYSSQNFLLWPNSSCKHTCLQTYISYHFLINITVQNYMWKYWNFLWFQMRLSRLYFRLILIKLVSKQDFIFSLYKNIILSHVWLVFFPISYKFKLYHYFNDRQCFSHIFNV